MTCETCNRQTVVTYDRDARAMTCVECGAPCDVPVVSMSLRTLRTLRTWMHADATIADLCEVLRTPGAQSVQLMICTHVGAA